MQGQINVSSEVNQGSTFTCEFDFPCHYEQELLFLGDNEEPVASFVSDAQVLVVEDNDVNQLVIVKMLEKFGIRVSTAFNGHEAIDIAQNKHFDLILMDCQMPEMDGFETTRWIRKQEGPNQQTPVVALTANVLATVKDRCIQAGMNDYVSKPVTRKKMAETLEQWIGKKGVEVSKKQNSDGVIDCN
jgi:CheY-like chemotaxis protein